MVLNSPVRELPFEVVLFRTYLVSLSTTHPLTSQGLKKHSFLVRCLPSDIRRGVLVYIKNGLSVLS